MKNLKFLAVYRKWRKKRRLISAVRYLEEDIKIAIGICQSGRREIRWLKGERDFLEIFSSAQIAEINQIDRELKVCLGALEKLLPISVDEKGSYQLVEKGRALQELQKKIMELQLELEKELPKTVQPGLAEKFFFGRVIHGFYSALDIFYKVIFFLKFKRKK